MDDKKRFEKQDIIIVLLVLLLVSYWTGVKVQQYYEYKNAFIYRCIESNVRVFYQIKGYYPEELDDTEFRELLEMEKSPESDNTYYFYVGQSLLYFFDYKDKVLVTYTYRGTDTFPDINYEY